MSQRRRNKESSKKSNALDALDAADTLFELGPIGLGMSVFGGAIAVVVGVVKFMSRRSRPPSSGSLPSDASTRPPS